MMAQMDKEDLQRILAIIAAESPVAQAVIQAAYEQRMRMHQEETINFEHYKREIMSIFMCHNERYLVYGQAYSDVKACIDGIAQQLNPQSPYGTKKNAIEALQDISLTIIRADGRRHAVRVRTEFERDDCIPQLMLRILQSMSVDDRHQVGAEITSYGATLLKSLEFTHEQAVISYIAGFYDFSIVLDLLRGRAWIRIAQVKPIVARILPQKVSCTWAWRVRMVPVSCTRSLGMNIPEREFQDCDIEEQEWRGISHPANVYYEYE